MTDNFTHSARPTRARAPEPWGIWAAIVGVILTLVVAVASLGVTGLVVVMVPAALGMLVFLSFVVFG